MKTLLVLFSFHHNNTEKIAKALNLVNLGYRIRYPANHLSGGERQKVAARCTRICLLENGVLYGEGG